MKKWFEEEQGIVFLREAEAGVAVKVLCRKACLAGKPGNGRIGYSLMVWSPNQNATDLEGHVAANLKSFIAFPNLKTGSYATILRFLPALKLWHNVIGRLPVFSVLFDFDRGMITAIRWPD